MTEKPKQEKKPPASRYIAVVGIDSGGKRYEPGDAVKLPGPLAADYLRRGKIRKAG